MLNEVVVIIGSAKSNQEHIRIHFSADERHQMIQESMREHIPSGAKIQN